MSFYTGWVKTGCPRNVLGESALPQRTDINRRDFRGRSVYKPTHAPQQKAIRLRADQRNGLNAVSGILSTTRNVIVAAAMR